MHCCRIKRAKSGSLHCKAFLGMAFVVGTSPFLFSEETTAPNIMVPGEYNEDVSADISNSSWIGLYETDSTVYLRNIALTARVFIDTFHNSTQLRTEITVDKRENLILIIRNEMSLQEGRIEVWYSGRLFLSPGQILWIDSMKNPSLRIPKFRAKKIMALGTATHGWGDRVPEIRDYALAILPSHERELERHFTRPWFQANVRESWPTIRIVGDLDRDGSFDMYLIQKYDYSMFFHALYLSGIAENGHHLAPVAELLYRPDWALE